MSRGRYIWAQGSSSKDGVGKKIKCHLLKHSGWRWKRQESKGCDLQFLVVLIEDFGTQATWTYFRATLIE